MSWRNADGLLIRFDLEKNSNKAPRGEAQGAGDVRVIDLLFNVVDAAPAGTFFPFYGDVIPSNSSIIKVTSDVIVAVAGTTAMTFGLQLYDGTELDYDGLLTAVTALTVGAHNDYVKGTTNAGALVGTVTVHPGILGVTLTGTPTGGRIKLSVHVLVPGKSPVPVVNF